MLKYLVVVAVGLTATLVQWWWLPVSSQSGFGSFPLSSILSLLDPRAGGSLRSDPDGVHVTIAILSRLEHLERRNAIRATWKRLLRPADRLFFVMAEQPCPIDPHWRYREAGCEPWHVQVPANTHESSAVRPYRVIPTAKRIVPGPPSPARDGLGLKVKFPINVVQLGIARQALLAFGHQQPQNNITVQLLDTGTREMVAQANFSKADLDAMPSDDGYLYHLVDEEMLSRGFEGILGLGTQFNQSWTGFSCSVDWNKRLGQDGPVIFNAAYINRLARPLSAAQDVCPLVTLIYTVPDLLELRQICVARETQNKCQENKNRNMATRLVEELEDNEDDIYLATELTDTGENAPLAILSFLEYLSSGRSPMPYYDYILITEDSAFLALDQITSKLPPADLVKVWRSEFQYSVSVEHQGKHMDRGFFADTYPPMPSPAGSVLSHDLADYLTHSRNALFHSFAGSLSASLAVWLAPTAPNYMEEPGWTHGNLPTSFVIGAAPLSKTEMLSAWSNYTDCGRIRGCK